MILNRIGKKTKIASKIIEHFPPHECFVDLFFGGGGLFFNKPKAKYNICNDLDGDVYNLFMVLMDRKEELYELIELCPHHTDLLNYWKANKETDPLKKAMRFLFLSNYTFMGMGETLRFSNQINTKQVLLSNIEPTKKFLNDVQFMNLDFRKALISYLDRSIKRETNTTFIYADPPYLGTTDNYSNSFTENDSNDLFDSLQATGSKWAMSEFDNDFVLDQAKERNLNIINIGERKNLGNRRTEILITNYKSNQLKMF
jgi:DNA adenine methylase